MKKKDKQLFEDCLICMSIGAIVRIFYCLKYPVPVRDAFVYKNIIEEWIKTGSIPLNIKGLPPLGLYLLKIPAEFFGFEVIQGGIIENVIIGLCIITITMIISEEIISSRFVVFLTGLFIATHKTFIDYSCQMIRENIYLFFSCLTIYYTIKYVKRGSLLHLCVASLCSAASVLCRHEGFELFILLCWIIILKEQYKRIFSVFSITLLVYLSSLVCISYAIGVHTKYYMTYFDRF